MVQCGDVGIARGGLFGVGFDTAEFGHKNTFGRLYPDILDLFYNESIIDSRAFGLYLNNGSEFCLLIENQTLYLGQVYPRTKQEGRWYLVDMISRNSLTR